MAQICNKKANSPRSSVGDSLYDRVDAPVATGSAHFMRAGAELHLLHVDLELGDIRLAAVRVASAQAALAAAIADYESSHQVAIELGFYPLHDERLRAWGGGEFGILDLLSESRERGLISMDDESASAIAGRYADGGDEAAFTGFITAVKSYTAELAAFDMAAANREPVIWQRFAWTAISGFDQLRIYGQALAIINTLRLQQETPASASRR